ncbi:hypothetical protein KA005_47350 [bacterium]|nr:hypothetical protein [bacterium]
MSNSKTKDYFIAEYEAWLKSYEVQFTHFMGVFYFWVAVVTFPATAGLIANQHHLSSGNFALLLYFLALIGFFLLAKMSDIRCSQLKYVRNMNEARYHLYKDAKEELPDSYDPRYVRNLNVREIALTDFGLIMAIVMSAVNAAYTGYASYLSSGATSRSTWYGVCAWVFGFLIYFCFVWFKLRPPKHQKQATPSDTQQGASPDS